MIKMTDAKIRHEAEIDAVPGLKEHLEEITYAAKRIFMEYHGSACLEDLKVLPSGVCAYVLDSHRWSEEGGGIGMTAVVGIYRDGRATEQRFKYRDERNSLRDCWEKAYAHIEDVVVEEEIARVIVRSSSETETLEFQLP